MSSVPTSLSALLKRATIEDHDEILRACNTASKQSKDDLETSHIKLVALLKLDRFDDALRVLEGGGDVLRQKAQLEWAYACYKYGDLEEAKKIAGGINDSRGARHVEAQALYRLEEFDSAARIYHDLAKSQSGIDGEENDLRINRGATDAQLELQLQGHLVQQKKPSREDMEAFETAYNSACGCIARGELGQAEVLLKRAKDLCNSLDELSDNDKKSEILPITVQQLFVLSSLGKTEEAEKLISDITIDDVPDLSTREIAQHNILVPSSTLLNPYLSQRLLQITTSPPKTDKLFKYQSERVHRNRLASDLSAMKYKGVMDSTLSHLSQYSSPTTSAHANGISVLHAAAHAQNQLGKLGLKAILPLMEKRPHDVGLIMTIIQLYILTNNHGSAITVMESFLRRIDDSKTLKDQDVRFAPGLVAILVSLYTIEGRKSQIKQELMRAASYWRHKSNYSVQLLQAAGLSLLESRKTEDMATAGEIFNTLRAKDPNDRLAIAGYVAAYAITSLEKVQDEVDKLSPVSRLIAGMDVDALEAAGVPLVESLSSNAMSRKRALEGKSKPPKKRVRKSRLPKDYDPSKAPDPERWLPLKDRSSYRPKGKKGKQKTGGLTQGGVSEKGSESVTAPASSGVIKPTGPPPGAPTKAKKKKGKK